MALKTYPWTAPPGGNCYGFAANCAHPGGAGKRPTPGAKVGRACQEPYDPVEVFKACVADGFVDMSGGVMCSNYKMAKAPDPPTNHYLVAVFVLEKKNSKLGSTDFHFVRQETGGGNWIHKMGPQDACNWDEKFQEMGKDLSKADMGGYTFVGYLAAPNAGVPVSFG